MKVLEYEKWRAETELASIRAALKAAGVKFEPIQKQIFMHEPHYVATQMFEGFRFVSPAKKSFKIIPVSGSQSLTSNT
jgi:hypothetical protein